MKSIGVILFSAAFLWIGCGGDESENSSPELSEDIASGPDSSEAEAEMETGVSTVTPLDDAICQVVLDRINSCGLFYSFETFEADCGEWAAGADSGRMIGLEDCSTQPCQPLLGCLEAIVNR